MTGGAEAKSNGSLSPEAMPGLRGRPTHRAENSARSSRSLRGGLAVMIRTRRSVIRRKCHTLKALSSRSGKFSSVARDSDRICRHSMLGVPQPVGNSRSPACCPPMVSAPLKVCRAWMIPRPISI